MYIGAQTKGRDGLPPDFLVRFKADVLAKYLTGPTVIPGKRLVAGSKPPSSGEIWQRWEATGFNVKVCSRDVDTGKEDLVDEFLHAQAYASIAQRIGDIPGSY